MSRSSVARQAFGGFLLAWTTATRAVAADAEVEFEADRVETDVEGSEITLDGNVAVRSERYQLTADKVQVRRTPRGVWVDGSGRVAACPCPDPPVSLGFERALIAPPTDLLLEDPTVRVGSVPVAWLPYVWLRSPRRWGALPPRLAWRAQDGLFAGTGVHAPLGDRGGADLRVGGYVRGGLEVEGRVATDETSTFVRWDHLEESLVAVDARGRAVPTSEGTLAWDVDALRGQRARSGPVPLEVISRRYDRARVGAMWASGPLVLGTGVIGDAERGGAIDTLGAMGPVLAVSVGSGVGDIGTARAGATLVTVDDPTRGVMTTVSHQGRMSADARVGPVGINTSAHSALVTAVEQATTRSAGAAGLTASMRLPLARSFATGWRHWLVPELSGGAKLARSREGPPAWIHGDGPTVHGGGGLRTTLGHHPSRTGVRLATLGGVVGPADSPSGAAVARATADTVPVGFAAEAGWAPGNVRDLEALGTLRLGSVDGLNLSPRAFGRMGDGARRARVLDGGGWSAPPAGWLDRSGWSVGASVAVPWTSWLASAADVDYDYERSRILGIGGVTAYRHPCGCLLVAGSAGRRVGRRGFDAMLTFDLAP